MWFASEIIRHNVFGTVVRWHLAKDWESYPASISNLKLDVQRSTRTDDEGRVYEDVSYKLKIVYKYAVNGTTYSNSRISFITSADSNPGQYNSRLYRKLEPLYQAGETTNVYVDPNNPRNSILDRSLNVAGLVTFLVFAFCLGGLGYVSLYTQLALWLRPRAESESSKAWARTVSLSFMVVMVSGCLLSFAIAYSALQDGDYHGLVALVFPALVVPIVIEYRLRGSRSTGSRTSIYLGVLWLTLSLPITYIEATSAPTYGLVSYVIFAVSLFGVALLIKGVANVVAALRN